MSMSTTGRTHILCGIVGTLVLSSCAPRPQPVSPEEIPSLERRIVENPDDGALQLRYAAALFAAGQCDSATAVAQRGRALSPELAQGPLVIGHCLEQANQFDDAVELYDQFVAAYPNANGADALRARALFARTERATTNARDALQRESVLANQQPNPDVVAVLPLEIVGDSVYRPLSRGLAQIMTSDLALLQRFRMVERLEIGAVMDEIDLSQGDAVDPQTAVRVGKLMQAGRLIQGTAVIPPDDDVRLVANVVLATGEIAGPETQTGPFTDLMMLEKQLVFDLARRLGYQLSQAEIRLILENGTQNLTAFLAYSRGILEEDLGNYGTAAALFTQAVQADPNFQQAQARQQATAAAAAEESSPTDVTVLAAASIAQLTTAFDVARVAFDRSLGDVASTLVERHTGNTDREADQSTNTPTSDPPTNIRIPPGVIERFVIVFIFVLP